MSCFWKLVPLGGHFLTISDGNRFIQMFFVNVYNCSENAFKMQLKYRQQNLATLNSYKPL